MNRECNLCTLNRIKARAFKEGKVVLEMKSDFLNGVDVYVHPKDVDITQLEGLKIPDHPTRRKYFVAWFMAVPEKCQC